MLPGRTTCIIPIQNAWDLTVFDYDDDGDLDIFQANDHQLNFLFRNDKGIFREVAVASGVAANSQGKGTVPCMDPLVMWMVTD